MWLHPLQTNLTFHTLNIKINVTNFDIYSYKNVHFYFTVHIVNKNFANYLLEKLLLQCKKGK